MCWCTSSVRFRSLGSVQAAFYDKVYNKAQIYSAERSFSCFSDVLCA